MQICVRPFILSVQTCLELFIFIFLAQIFKLQSQVSLLALYQIQRTLPILRRTVGYRVEEPKILRLGISFDNDTRASRKLIGRITTKSFFMKMS